MDTEQLYAETRARLLALGSGLGEEETAREVPALPGWTVKDTYAHLTGLCSDVLASRMEGAGSPAWTARQVDERARSPLPVIADEWTELGPRLDSWLRGQGHTGAPFVVFDVWAHEQDVRGAVGLRGVRDDDRVRFLAGLALPVFDRRFAQEGAPALRVVLGGEEHVLGEGQPGATLHLDHYELLRVLFGRRSLDQLRGADWEGEPEPYLPHLHLFETPVHDLVD